MNCSRSCLTVLVATLRSPLQRRREQQLEIFCECYCRKKICALGASLDLHELKVTSLSRLLCVKQLSRLLTCQPALAHNTRCVPHATQDTHKHTNAHAHSRTHDVDTLDAAQHAATMSASAHTRHTRCVPHTAQHTHADTHTMLTLHYSTLP